MSQPISVPVTDTPASTFDDKLAAWREWQQAPWGRMRYSVVWHVLMQHLTAPANMRLRIIDVGGGDGSEAIRLAELGHEVTLVDYSQAMLDVARGCAVERGVADRLTCIEGQVTELDRLIAPGRAPYDVALCHFVIGYLDNPAVVLKQIAGLLAPTGWLSLVAANPASDVLAKVVRERDIDGALAMLDATKAHAATFDHAVHRITPQDGERLLVDAGFRQHARYGGRSIIDLITDDAIKHDTETYAKIEQLELAVCARSPYRDIARFWQLIARPSPS